MIFRKNLLLILFGLLTVATFGQKQLQSNFKFGVDLYTDIWSDLPAGIETRTINQGVSAYGMYDSPFQNSRVSVAIGLGFGAHNMYSNGLLTVNDDGNSEFIPYPEETEDGDRITYKRIKLSLAYIDLPVALRYRAVKGFRLSIGFKVGYKINAHTKYVGDALDGSGKEILVKEKKLDNIEDFRYGPTMSLGYKWVNFVGFYSISKVFKSGRGPSIYPISIGISLRPF